ncbi:hypothetical protein niasHT_021445 [Heterodera trifolii]|uniref:Uncharacterized protein n=1 Tax=Heterodera trifolii TaxID=157864 RepID=A0ABD2KIV4_9BILA
MQRKEQKTKNININNDDDGNENEKNGNDSNFMPSDASAFKTYEKREKAKSAKMGKNDELDGAGAEKSDRRGEAKVVEKALQKQKKTDGTASKQRPMGKSKARNAITEQRRLNEEEAAAVAVDQMSEPAGIDGEEAEPSRHQSLTPSKRQRSARKKPNKSQWDVQPKSTGTVSEAEISADDNSTRNLPPAADGPSDGSEPSSSSKGVNNSPLALVNNWQRPQIESRFREQTRRIDELGQEVAELKQWKAQQEQKQLNQSQEEAWRQQWHSFVSVQQMMALQAQAQQMAHFQSTNIQDLEQQSETDQQQTLFRPIAAHGSVTECTATAEEEEKQHKIQENGQHEQGGHQDEGVQQLQQQFEENKQQTTDVLMNSYHDKPREAQHEGQQEEDEQHKVQQQQLQGTPTQQLKTLAQRKTEQQEQLTGEQQQQLEQQWHHLLTVEQPISRSESSPAQLVHSSAANEQHPFGQKNAQIGQQQQPLQQLQFHANPRQFPVQQQRNIMSPAFQMQPQQIRLVQQMQQQQHQQMMAHRRSQSSPTQLTPAPVAVQQPLTTENALLQCVQRKQQQQQQQQTVAAMNAAVHHQTDYQNQHHFLAPLPLMKKPTQRQQAALLLSDQLTKEPQQQQQQTPPSNLNLEKISRAAHLNALISSLRQRSMAAVASSSGNPMEIAQPNTNATIAAAWGHGQLQPQQRPQWRQLQTPAAVAGRAFTASPNAPSASSSTNSSLLAKVKERILALLAEDVDDVNWLDYENGLIQPKPSLQMAKEMAQKALVESIAALYLNPLQLDLMHSLEQTVNGIFWGEQNFPLAETMAKKIHSCTFSHSLVIDKMRRTINDENVQRILAEIEEEIADFESQTMGQNGGQMAEGVKLLLTFTRLYHKLSNRVKSMMYGQNYNEQNNNLEVNNWMQRIDKLGDAFGGQMTKVIAQQPPAFRNWYEKLCMLESAIESAKLAILVAFPATLFNNWANHLSNWSFLKGQFRDIDLYDFLAYQEERQWFGSDFSIKIRENGGDRFGAYTVKIVADFLGQISRTMNAHFAFISADPCKKNEQIFYLALFSSLFRRIISELKEAKFDVILTKTLKRERQIAQKMLEISAMIFDAKFELLKNMVIGNILTLDRIREGRSGGGGKAAAEGTAGPSARK